MPYRSGPAALVLALTALGIAGCSSGAAASSSGATGPLPSTDETKAFTRVTNLLTVPVDVDGTTGILGVDTGSPIVLLSPTEYPRAPAVGDVARLSVESRSLTNLQVVTSSQSPPSPDPALPLGGLLGCAAICGTVVSFDYAGAAFTIGASAAPPGLLADTAVSFSLEGGGTATQGGQDVTIPRSRIVVEVDIEGGTHTMILDTGASTVAVNAALFASLTKDGRAQRTVGGVETTAGASSASFARVKTVSLGGASAESVIVSHDASFDNNLQAVSDELGKTIEGSLGGTFLTNFYLVIDYPNQQVHLARYADTSFVVDLGAAMGFQLGLRDGSFVVASVKAGSDAATKGVSAGDAVVAIDGQSLAGLTDSELGVALGGQVGATKQVTFGSAQKLAGKTVPVLVEDLLPP